MAAGTADVGGLLEPVRSTVVLPPVLGTVGGITCPACGQMMPGAPVIKRLTAGRVTVPGVGYTIIASKDDRAVTPQGTSFIHEPGVRNLYVQDRCPGYHVDHASMPSDPVVGQVVREALGERGTQRLRCALHRL